MKSAKDCKTLEDWYEWATLDRVALASFGTLTFEQKLRTTPEKMKKAMLLNVKTALELRQLTAEMMEDEPRYGRRTELMEKIYYSDTEYLTTEQLAAALDTSTEELEMNGVRQGILDSDEQGNVTPTEKAKHHGLVKPE